jgi:hypothetical protein
VPLDKKHNFSKFVKKDIKIRENHAKDDCSHDISPFINRLGGKSNAVKEM